MRRTPSPAQLRAIRLAVFLLALAPFALTVYDGFTAGLGINPVETLTHRSGDWALRFLLLTLAITPLRRLTGAHWLIRLRRMLGLYAFLYACLHFLVFAVFDHSLDLAAVLADVIDRPFILAGFLALLLLLPLALTSTKGMMRRLGRNWQRLHRLVYPATALVILHFFMIVKADNTEPAIYGLLLAVLLLTRLRRT